MKERGEGRKQGKELSKASTGWNQLPHDLTGALEYKWYQRVGPT